MKDLCSPCKLGLGLQLVWPLRSKIAFLPHLLVFVNPPQEFLFMRFKQSHKDDENHKKHLLNSYTLSCLQSPPTPRQGWSPTQNSISLGLLIQSMHTVLQGPSHWTPARRDPQAALPYLCSFPLHTNGFRVGWESFLNSNPGWRREGRLEDENKAQGKNICSSWTTSHSPKLPHNTLICV